MIPAPGEAKRKRLREVGAEYERRGYQVLTAPSPAQLPEFLQPFEPDMVAEGPDESVVVEVKPPGRSVSPEHWRRLAEVLDTQPGWRLELIVGHSSFGEDLAPLGRREILARLQEGKELLEEGRSDAALLMTWAAAEAAVRLLFEAGDVEAPDRRPGTLITRLFSEGLLNREEYDVLMQGMRLRNAISHGFRASGYCSEFVTRLGRSARRLLSEAAQFRRTATPDRVVARSATSSRAG